MASLDSQIQKKHGYERVETNQYVPANIWFCSFYSLIPETFLTTQVACYLKQL